MLESILRNTFTRYIALATAITISAPAYAQMPASEDNSAEQQAAPSADSEGAYYIDPTKKKGKKKRAEEKPAYLQDEPTEVEGNLSEPQLDFVPRTRESIPPYVTPSNNEEKNTRNDTAGYLLTVAGAGLTALVLIPYAMADKCPEGIQEGGIVKECNKRLTERGWAALSVGIVSMGVGLYFIFD